MTSSGATAKSAADAAVPARLPATKPPPTADHRGLTIGLDVQSVGLLNESENGFLITRSVGVGGEIKM